jgi:Cu2+-exporting ATPase
MAWVRQQQEQGKVLAMVGDGLNDAPTLATADVSFSLGESTALANNHSDFVILGNHLQAIPCLLSLARITMSRIRQNIAWAFVYNLIAVPFAVAGFVPPWAAAIGMSLSSIIVVMNSMRIRRQSLD